MKSPKPKHLKEKIKLRAAIAALRLNRTVEFDLKTFPPFPDYIPFYAEGTTEMVLDLEHSSLAIFPNDLGTSVSYLATFETWVSSWNRYITQSPASIYVEFYAGDGKYLGSTDLVIFSLQYINGDNYTRNLRLQTPQPISLPAIFVENAYSIRLSIVGSFLKG